MVPADLHELKPEKLFSSHWHGMLRMACPSIHSSFSFSFSTVSHEELSNLNPHFFIECIPYYRGNLLLFFPNALHLSGKATQTSIFPSNAETNTLAQRFCSELCTVFRISRALPNVAAEHMCLTQGQNH